mgnify:CR=1 FL=1
MKIKNYFKKGYNIWDIYVIIFVIAPPYSARYTERIDAAVKCPYCAQLESKVVDSRPADEGSSIRRRRECLACRKRFTT